MRKTPAKPPEPARPTGLASVLTAAKLLVFGQFRLRRRGPGVQGVHVVFGETVLAPPAPPAEPPAPASPAEPTAASQANTATSPVAKRSSGRTLSTAERRVHQDLVTALEAQGEHKLVFRHLVYLEQQIGRAGLGGLSRLPVDVVAKSFDQLSLISGDQSALGLVELKTRLSRVLLSQGHKDHLMTDEQATPSDFLQHTQPEVQEGRLSDFEFENDDNALVSR